MTDHPESLRAGTGGLTLAVMQPYFLPYIGYFQLMAAADAFVIYDNIKYTKKGWINRNRRLQNGGDVMFSLPLKKASDSLDVVERELTPDFDPAALLNQFRGSYAKAPYFSGVFPLLERILRHDETNLFRYIRHSVAELCAHLGIATKIVTSSTLPIDDHLQAQDKVIALCRTAKADAYVNPIGGTELYDHDTFAEQGIELRFLKPLPFEYEQLGNPFVPWLSIVDVLMFNPLETVCNRIASGYELV